MESTLDASCPSCQKEYRRVRKELIGKKALCTCGHTFKLGETNSSNDREPTGESTTASGTVFDSVDLSSAGVFENSYGDLDQILSGHGSTAPLPENTSDKPAVASPIKSQPTAKPFTPSGTPPNKRVQVESIPGYGSTGMSVGFLAAVLSACIAGWFSLFVVSSRYSVIESQPLNLVSQTLHDSGRATFGDLVISPELERSFVAFGWIIWIVAAGLLILAIGQLVNAFAKLFRRRHLLPGIDGITGLTATALLFLLLGTIFFHFGHMRELNRDLIQKAGGQIDTDTLLGRNVQELQSTHAAHSRQFMASMIAASSVPLCVCLLSLSRVYVTLGETEFTPPRRGSP